MGILDTLFGGSQNQSAPAGSPYLSQEDYFRRLAQARQLAGPEPTADFPAFQEFPELRTIAPEGFDRFEEATFERGAGRLNIDRQAATDRFRAAMRRIGLADDPASFKLQEETIDEPFARGLSDLALGTTAQRYQIEAPFQSNLNIQDTQRGGIANEFALNRYTAPRDFYLNKLNQFNQFPTANRGVISSGTKTGGIIPGLGSLAGGTGSLLRGIKA